MNRMKRRPILAAVSVALMMTSGCAGKTEPPSPPGPKTTTSAASYDDLLRQKTITRDVSLAVGDTLQISLGSNASTGYRWNPDLTISNTAVLAQAGHEVITPSGAPPGAPGSEVWALQATGPGTATVTGSYSQPWSGGEKDTWTFTAKVTVS